MKPHTQRRVLTAIALASIIASTLLLSGCAVNSSDLINALILVFTGIPALVASAGVLIPGPVGAALTLISGLVSATLSLVLKALQNYNNNPTDANLAALQSTMTAAHTQVAQYNAAVQITDPATAAKFAAFGTTAVTTLANLEATTVAQHANTQAQSAQANADGL
jgi:archaellum component FlaF (FlaF/FlaG flagellin family)